MSIDLPAAIIDKLIATVDMGSTGVYTASRILLALMDDGLLDPVKVHVGVISQAASVVDDAKATGRNERGIVYAVIRALRDAGVDLVSPDGP